MKIQRIHETDQPIDDAIAIDRLNLVRYCASGLVAGGAGVTLTMLLTGLTVQPQSVVALRVLGTLLLASGLAFIRRAVIWTGLAVPRKLTAWTAAILVYQLVSATIVRPEHAAKGFSGGWWELLGQAVFTTFIGAALRYWAEMEIDDLQYGFDHGMATVQTFGTQGE